MSTLFNITKDYLEVLELIEQGEFDKETLDTTLECVDAELEVKADNIVNVIKVLESRNIAINKELERLKALKDSNKRGVETLKANLLNSMLITNKLKFKTDLHNFSTRKSASVQITDETNIDKDFITETTVIKIDKNSIKDAIKNGQVVKGVELVEKINLSYR